MPTRKQNDNRRPGRASGAASAPDTGGDAAAGKSSISLSRSLVIQNPNGLHTRPAALVAGLARQHQSRLTLIVGDSRVDARNAFELLALGAQQGTELIIEAEGPDAAELLDQVFDLLEKFEDAED